jgi:hypothetical protein
VSSSGLGESGTVGSFDRHDALCDEVAQPCETQGFVVFLRSVTIADCLDDGDRSMRSGKQWEESASGFWQVSNPESGAVTSTENF